MKNYPQVPIPLTLRLLAMLPCNPYLAITDFNFAVNPKHNQRLFEMAFTLQPDQEMIALEASLRGYNDNLN
jgi:hypothetical protein